MKKELIILATVISSIFSYSAKAEDIVRICHGSGGYPPYHFYPQGVNEGKMSGLTIDVLKPLFEVLDMPYDVNPIPWKRCYKHTLSGQGFDIIADGSYNLERANLFYYSTPLYTLTPTLFTKIDETKQARPITKPEQLKKLQLCANRGTNLMGYGVVKSDISNETSSIRNGLEMLDKGRCEGFLSLQEIVSGHYYMDKGNSLPSGISASPITYAKAWTMHLIISRHAKNAKDLTFRINQEILRLQHNGVIDKIAQKYATEAR
ncbi:substrate-binding periplasmic protein [Candidatus Terasakiella magnetica]|uniref:substrate-binding periplasmic protein n=1 Tax=Candidatus Terasakiella magnetica TaxID=1867952 RepID=UPI0013F4E0BD|nr:transporter substrate-binding domain-containing protein [Candidatus Terasakiella magnetica]